MEDINLLLSYIETEVMDGKKTFIGDKTAVDGEAILSLVKRIRASLDEATGKNVLREATDKAKNIIALAEQKRDQILSKDVVIDQARAIADKICSDAVSYQKSVEKDVRDSVTKMLVDVKKNLVGMETYVDEQIVLVQKDNK